MFGLNGAVAAPRQKRCKPKAETKFALAMLRRSPFSRQAKLKLRWATPNPLRLGHVQALFCLHMALGLIGGLALHSACTIFVPMQGNDLRKTVSGFDYLLKQMDLQSAVGRDALSALPWSGPGDEAALSVELKRVDAMKAYLAAGTTLLLEKIKIKFAQIWDIRNSFKLLQEGPVDDIQLFEIKRFAILSGEAGKTLVELVQVCGFENPPRVFPDLSEVVSLLDPRGEKLPVFYIYDEYDARLAQARKALLQLDETAEVVQVQDGRCRCVAGDAGIENAGETLLSGTGKTGSDLGLENGSSRDFKRVDAEMVRLQTECLALEQEIRVSLSAKLRPFVPVLQETMDLVAYWDMLIAKASLAWRFDLVLPEIHVREVKRNDPVSGPSGREFSLSVSYEGLFHPMVKALVEERKGRYQAVDICLKAGPCVLTGANMSGKTVLLKSLALSQCLFQSGFLVPARRAELALFDSVALLVQDEQSEERGLSSFGAEMQRLDAVLTRLEKGEKMLLLVDELARTTNPMEGKAIVRAVLDTLQELPCVGLVSTHYGPIPDPVRHLRVRGFREDWISGADGMVASLPGASLPSASPSLGSGKESQAPSLLLERVPGTADGKQGFELSRIQACMDYSVVEEEPMETPPMEALRIAFLLGFDAGVLAKAQAYYEEENGK